MIEFDLHLKQYLTSIHETRLFLVALKKEVLLLEKEAKEIKYIIMEKENIYDSPIKELFPSIPYENSFLETYQKTSNKPGVYFIENSIVLPLFKVHDLAVIYKTEKKHLKTRYKISLDILSKYTFHDLLKIKNFGRKKLEGMRKTLEEIEDFHKGGKND